VYISFLTWWYIDYLRFAVDCGSTKLPHDKASAR
jgi:hypothetical protein